MTTPQQRQLAPDNSSASQTLPPELLAEAARRLGWLGLIYAGTYLMAHFGSQFLVGPAAAAETTPAQDVFAIAAILMGLSAFVFSRQTMISPLRLLNWGLAFEVVGAFGIAINEFWLGLDLKVGGRFNGIPYECVWIVVFPLIAPNTPRKVLIASLLAASVGPATVILAGAITGRDYVGPPALFVSFFLFSNYLCAVLAYVAARIVHRYELRLKRAREIGSYELVRKLGEGGMGEVWKARHRLLARPAAIKLIRNELLGSNEKMRDTVVRRFKREAQETATLGSTHTVDIHDFGVAEDGSFYYVMELLNGLSLDACVRRFGPMEPSRVVYLLSQACHSLGEAHGRGLIHRDIKPSNIFMCRLGPDCDFVKVLDFGLVKHVEQSVPGSMLTMEGATAGTPTYMAPEMALGQQGVDGRADLYALGCVAYFLLTGQDVFSADTPLATILAHVRESPVPPSARSEIVIPAELESVVLACLSKDPSGRPATAEELSVMLAGSLPGSRWTEARAREWWDLHQLGSAAAEPEPEDGAEAPAKKDWRRCWPRLETPSETRSKAEA